MQKRFDAQFWRQKDFSNDGPGCNFVYFGDAALKLKPKLKNNTRHVAVTFVPFALISNHWLKLVIKFLSLK